jgi:hypothetical protein
MMGVNTDGAFADLMQGAHEPNPPATKPAAAVGLFWIFAIQTALNAFALIAILAARDEVLTLLTNDLGYTTESVPLWVVDVIGGGLAILTLINVITAVGLQKGRNWGLKLAKVMSVLGIVRALSGLHVLGLLLNGAVLYLSSRRDVHTWFAGGRGSNQVR